MGFIESSSVFCNASVNTEASVRSQLTLALTKLRSNSNRITNPIIGTLFGDSNDHGNDCTQRVAEALYLVSHDWTR